MLKGSRVTRTHSHQLTALSLSILRREAYSKYTGDCQENGDEFAAWCNKKRETLPQFKYWQTVYDIRGRSSYFEREMTTTQPLGCSEEESAGGGCAPPEEAKILALL